MDKVRSKLDTSKSGLLRRNRNNAVGSKMKIERLKAMLENLKDDEKQSRVRNQHLLQDFDKVNELSDDLDTKARKLKRVKQEYEKYITSVYPHWKENVEISRMTRLKSPDEEFKSRKDQHFSGHRDEWSLDRKGQMNAQLSPLYSRYLEGESRLSSTHYGKSTDNNPYLSHSHVHSPRDEISVGFAQQDPSMTVRSKSLDPVHADNYQYGRSTLNVNNEWDRSIRLSQVPPFDSSAAVNTGQRSSTSQVKPNQLNIPRVRESADISSFTILPQALALSPDGQLVLLPMACSPQVNLSRDLRNETSSSKMKSKIGNLDGDSSNFNHDNFDVSSRTPDNSMSRANQNTRTANGKVPEHEKMSVSLLNTNDQFARSKVGGNVFHDDENEVLGRQSMGEFKVDDECRFSMTEYEKMENDIKDIGGKSDENHSDNDKIIRKKDIVAENSLTIQSHQSKKHLLSRSGSNALEQSEKINDGINGSKHVSEGHFNDKSNDKEKQFDSTCKPLDEEQSVNVRDKDELSDDVKNNVLVKEEGREAFDMKSHLHDVKRLENDDEGKVFEEVTIAANEYTSLEAAKSEFINDESARNYDSEKVDLNGVESTELNKPVFEVEEDKGMTDVNNGTITSGVKVDGYDYDTVNKKSTSDDIELNNEISKEENRLKIGKTQKKERFLDIPEISYLFEEIENRMEYVDRSEFYRKQVEDTSYDSLTEIRKVLLLEGNLSEFETCDLCIVSRLSVEEFVERNSRSGFIIREDKDLSTIYTLDGFREILLSNFEELWEYIFNHMELLTANQIFEPTAVCEIFSKMLCPGCPAIAFEVSQTVLRIMDGVDERVSFEDDQEYSLEDEELSAVESDKSQNDIEINHEDLSSEKRDNEVATEGKILTAASPSQEFKIRNEAGNKESTNDPIVNTSSFDKQNPPKERKGNDDDLLLDLGDLSNDDDDDDDDSTFDSTKLTPHRTVEVSGQQNSNAIGVSSGGEDTISERSSEQIDEDVSKKMEGEKDEDGENESSDDLEDLLSTSLVLNGNKNKKDAAQNRKPLSFFEQKRDSFDVDENNSMQKITHPTEKKDISSPQHSKSISSKFRKPGFWDNSDSESEAGDLNISAGNKLSNHNASEDEFDFDFYT